MKIDDILKAEIISLGINGEGVAKVDGFVIFIPFALVGEVVNIKIVSIVKNFANAEIVEILHASDKRQKPTCPYFQECGGCQIQHLEYAEQTEYKQSKVCETITKFLHKKIDVSKCVASENEFEYRNKIELNFSKNGLGYFDINNKKIILIKNCPIFCEKNAIFGEIIAIFNKFAENNKKNIYQKNTNIGVIKSLIIRKIENEYAFTLVLTKNIKLEFDSLFEELENLNLQFSFFVSINEIKNSSHITSKIILIKGKPKQNIVNYGIVQTISPNSFLQINQKICEKVYDKICSYITCESVVVDAYSGAGLLSAIMSNRAKCVYAIEIVENAVKDAQNMAIQNGISNIVNICGDCGKELDKVLKTVKIDTIVLDPPRKGCDASVLEAISKSDVEKIIYLSCNVATLSRDLVKLSEKYDIVETTPFDMFPQTCQVETLVYLIKK